MEIIFIISGAIVLSVAIFGIILFDKMNRFNNSIAQMMHSQALFNQIVCRNNPNVWDEYEKERDVIERRVGKSAQKKQFDGLFEFSPSLKDDLYLYQNASKYYK